MPRSGVGLALRLDRLPRATVHRSSTRAMDHEKSSVLLKGERTVRSTVLSSIVFSDPVVCIRLGAVSQNGCYRETNCRFSTLYICMFDQVTDSVLYHHEANFVL